MFKTKFDTHRNRSGEMNTKDRILKVTLDILKHEGLDKITVRRIAEEAGVNIASINYHFGTKDNLISGAVEVILKDARHTFDFLYDEKLEPRERLKRFLINYAKIGIENPEALRQLLLKGTFDYDSQKNYLYYLKTSGIEKVKDTIRQMTGNDDEEALTMMVFQMCSTMLFLCIIQPVITNMLDYDIHMEEEVDKYFDLVLAR